MRSGRRSFVLDVYNEETAKQYDRYVAFVRQKAPGVTELATPRPLPVREFQRRLQGHEAIVATLVTPLDLYVWAITASSVTLTRHAITRAGRRGQGTAAARRPAPGRGQSACLRRGGRSRALPADLRALGEARSSGVRNVIWYGHGPLGAVPPAVLVTAPPPGRSCAALRNSPRRSSWSTGMLSLSWRTCRFSPGTAIGRSARGGAALPRRRRADVVRRGAGRCLARPIVRAGRRRCHRAGHGGSCAPAEARGIGRRDEGAGRASPARRTRRFGSGRRPTSADSSATSCGATGRLRSRRMVSCRARSRTCPSPR